MISIKFSVCLEVQEGAPDLFAGELIVREEFLPLMISGFLFFGAPSDAP